MHEWNLTYDRQFSPNPICPKPLVSRLGRYRGLTIGSMMGLREPSGDSYAFY